MLGNSAVSPAPKPDLDGNPRLRARGAHGMRANQIELCVTSGLSRHGGPILQLPSEGFKRGFNSTGGVTGGEPWTKLLLMHKHYGFSTAVDLFSFFIIPCFTEQTFALPLKKT